MNGLIVNCKTGKATKIDDGLPMPEHAIEDEPKGINLKDVAKMLDDYYKEPK